MCGIAGVADRDGVRDRAMLVRMRDSLRHRGPDDEGEWWSEDGRVGFGHRRLAVIDLTPGGHQPMSDQTGSTVIFNGEIYNYQELRRRLEGLGRRFRSDSDTEVILHAYAQWGNDCLEHLDGMFAFALMDSRQGCLLLARDRVGEKPLYYGIAGGRLTFASEIKALLTVAGQPRRVDPAALDAYLAYGYVPGRLSMLAGINKLPAAHALTFDVGSAATNTWRYWQLPPEPLDIAAPLEPMLEEFESLLEASVRRQLVADVPVGVLLSGGIDSGLVTALAARVSPQPVRTFTIAVPGDPTLDEAPAARAIARHCGTVHTELPAEPSSFSLLPMLARQFDEPIGDSSIVPTYVVARLIRQHATVALGGDGGDELFGGYPHYAWLCRQQRMRHWTPAFVRRELAHAGRALPVGTRGRNHLIGFDDGLDRSLAHVNLFFDDRTRERLSPVLRGGGFERAESFRTGFSEASGVIRRATETDFATTLADGYLVKVDRSSMLNSLEIRAPFLGRSVVEFAFGRVPSRLKVSGNTLKLLPRRLAERLLPPGTDTRPKRGFSVPLSAWFKGGWDEVMTEVLHGTDPGLLDSTVVDGLLDGQRGGYANAQRLFALTMLELWRREYAVSV
jgi:asparagine synthase (glutamine-hydrolysing)